MKTPIYSGLLQSDLDTNGFDILGFTPGGGGSGGLPEGWVSVMDYGAAADGVTNDTAAAQAAIAAATAAVYFPPGNYFFSGSIGNVPANISLIGSFQGPTGAVMDTSNIYDHSNQRNPLSGGTTFLLTANAGNGSGTSFITINDNCAIIGITFYWPNQSKVAATPTAYPWAIHFNGGTAGSVKYCNFVNAYQGIYIENTLFSLVEEVRGQMLYRGIKMEGNYDVTRLRGVHFNSSWHYSESTGAGWYQLNNSIAFDFGRNDFALITDCFAFSYFCWMHFYNDLAHAFHGPTAPWIWIYGGGCNSCMKPVWVEQTAEVVVVGCSMDTYVGTSLQVVTVDSTHTGVFYLKNCEIAATGTGKFGAIASGGATVVDGCSFGEGAYVTGVVPTPHGSTGWVITGTGNFAMRDCYTNTSQTHVSLAATLNRAVVTGNMASDTFVVSNSMVPGRFIISGNTGETAVYIGADARLVSISGGVKLEVRNTGTGTWLEATRYTNP
jgi:hypothetical protein